jgi:DNA-binding beta-propeller fold protein YncE
MNCKTNGYRASIMATALATALLTLAGCTDTADQAKPAEEPTDLVWPLPPEQPRIKYVRSISSPADIGATVTRSLTSSLLGEQEQATARMEKPYAVTADDSGRIFVGDTGLGKLLVFDVENRKFEIWGQSGPGALKLPLGIASDSQGRIYVTDGKQKRLIVFDRTGEFIMAMGGKDQLERPVGIAIDEARDRIYVVDSHIHAIMVFDMDGKFVSQIGKRGKEPGQFNFPTNIAIDKDGKLYVVDGMNFRVQILRPDGSPVATFGQHSDLPGSLARPKGIGIDPDGHIYVVDAAFNNFQIFDKDGALLLIVGVAGRGPGEFYLPAAAFLDSQGRFYVVDQFNYRVQIFQYLGDSAAPPAPVPAAAETSTDSPPQ